MFLIVAVIMYTLRHVLVLIIDEETYEILSKRVVYFKLTKT